MKNNKQEINKVLFLYQHAQVNNDGIQKEFFTDFVDQQTVFFAYLVLSKYQITV